MSTLSIIIPNWNGLKHLPECLGSIDSQSYHDYEIILIDNGSSDGSIEYLEANYPQVQIVKNPTNFGFCKAANQGIQAAQGKYLLLLNNDTRLDPQFLTSVMDCWSAAPDYIIGIFPKAIYYHRPEVINSAGVQWTRWGFWQTYSDGLPNKNFEADRLFVFGDRFIAPCFRLDLLKKIGGFDEHFFSFSEDFDVSYRANVLGYRFIFCQRAIIYHKMSQSLQDNRIHQAYKLRLGLRNYTFVILKNYATKNIILYLPWFVIRIFLYHGIIRPLYSWGFKNSPLILHTFFSALIDINRSLPIILKQRKSIQQSRLITDEQIWDRERMEPVTWPG